MPETAPQCLLAIDLGTSGPKVALFSAAAEPLDSELEPVGLHLQPGGGAEQDPAEWWAAIVAATRRLLARQPEAARQVVALGCTAQWSGTVAVDAAGEALGPALIWMDSRGAPHVRRLTRGFPRLFGYGARKLLTWVRLTGGVPGHSGKDSLGHILYLRHERPDVWARAATFLEPKDWLNLKLTGRRAASYDSITLHWVTDNRDPWRVDYHPQLLAWTGLARERLPPLRRATDVLGPLRPEVARELGVPPGAQVVVGSPDVQSAAVGSGAVADYAPHLYIGTSSWLTCHVPFLKTDPGTNLVSLPSAIPGRYFVAAAQECAGVCLTFLRDNVFFPRDALDGAPAPPDVYPAFDRLVAQAPAGAGRVLFAPWLYGERTPVEDPLVRGGFYNVSLSTTRAHLVRAVYEGVAFNARWLLQSVERFVRRPFGALNFIGGGARSAVWAQVLADVLDRPVRQMADPQQANTRGAAMIAAVGLGLARFEDLAARVPAQATFTPSADHRALYDSLFGEFVRLYRANRPIHARLNRGQPRGPP